MKNQVKRGRPRKNQVIGNVEVKRWKPELVKMNDIKFDDNLFVPMKTGKKIDSLSQENKISPRPRLNIFSLTGAILTFAGLIFWIYIGFFDVSYGSANEVPSVAILMMENLGNTQDEFWARGITEDLIVKLAGAGLLRVASIQQIKKINIDDDMEEIAKNLDVRYILYSSIFKNEEKFDLKTQLIDVSSGISLLGDKWSEPLDNAPKIVGLLASDILDALDVTSKQNIERAPTENLLAYELYIKGKQIYKHINNEYIKSNIRFLTRLLI